MWTHHCLWKPQAPTTGNGAQGSESPSQRSPVQRRNRRGLDHPPSSVLTSSSPVPHPSARWETIIGAREGCRPACGWQAGTRELPLASVPTDSRASEISKGLGGMGLGLGVAVPLSQEALGTPSPTPGPGSVSLWKVAMQFPLLSPQSPLQSFTTSHWTDSAPTVCSAASGDGAAEVKAQWSPPCRWLAFLPFPCARLFQTPRGSAMCTGAMLAPGEAGKLSAWEASRSPGERGHGGQRMGLGVKAGHGALRSPHTLLGGFRRSCSALPAGAQVSPSGRRDPRVTASGRGSPGGHGALRPASCSDLFTFSGGDRAK